MPHLTSSLLATNFGSPSGITTQDKYILHLWHVSFYFAAPIGVIVIALVVWCIVRYRAKPGRFPAQHQYHIPLEITYTVIPLVVVAILFGYMYQAENKINRVAKNPDVKIEVDGFQWGWRFTYNMVNVNGKQLTPGFQEVGSVANEPSINDDSVLPTLVVPENETVQFNLKALDVIHSFYIIDTLFKRDLIPGVNNVVDMNFKTTGTFIGECTQFCGTYHPFMRFNVEIMKPADFANWVSQQRPGQVYYAGKPNHAGIPGNEFGIVGQ